MCEMVEPRVAPAEDASTGPDPARPRPIRVTVIPLAFSLPAKTFAASMEVSATSWRSTTRARSQVVSAGM